MRQSIVKRALRRESGQHPGLLLQRFLREPATGENGNPDEKRALLNAAIAAASAADLRVLYRSAFERWEKLLVNWTAANDFVTIGRLIVGLGSENVLETGIRLHHTYGLPVIPGSALKGLAAHYCHEVWGQLANAEVAPDECKQFRRNTGEYHRLLFGTTEDCGCITFHDSWLTPASPAPLVMDVMTPHHPRWLDGEVPPTDFDSPVPVPFVSASGTFRVAVSWTGPDNSEVQQWTELCFELLVEALRDWGIGGKTSSGYGRLVELDANQRKKPFSAAALGLPDLGATVQATLLDVPKRNKPWRAKITLQTRRELAGPVEPIEGTPADVAPKKIVKVIVTHVDEKSIRFTWSK